ncbi:MAG: type II CRISPR RNA-guided endonuclease Cas9 [Candidatus Hydrogenedentes bacterium]|nr:type II CRISPR RNA-guided endonuclease Cas9 [Candidatus Hydrogenedentota bacterium]
MNDAESVETTILGVDLGANSLGWALLSTVDDEHFTIKDMGVRVFPIAAQEGKSSSYAWGTDKPAGQERREARQIRRQFFRRAQRMRNVGRVLQRHGLLPAGNVGNKDTRHQLIGSLDTELQKKWLSVFKAEEDRKPITDQFPYFLRARGIQHRLDPYELGRALYHLGQRRGFKSNRKALGQDDEKKGKVESEIKRLNQELQAKDFQTLGEMFAAQDPHERRIRGPGHYTHRNQREDEFKTLWQKQYEYDPDTLTKTAFDDIQAAIFDQRLLKPQDHLIGSCQFEKDQKRAPKALLNCQEFRIWEQLGRLRILVPHQDERPLDLAEQKQLADVLDMKESLSFVQIRKLLALPPETIFNLDREGGKRAPRDKTESKISKVLGARWNNFPREERQALIEVVRETEDAEKLEDELTGRWTLSEQEAAEIAKIHQGAKKRGLIGNKTSCAIGKILRSKWNCFAQDEKKELVGYILDIEDESEFRTRVLQRWALTESEVKRLNEAKLEAGYVSLSLKAMSRLLPLMRRGVAVEKARKEVYGDERLELPCLDTLPPVQTIMHDFKNPVVVRALSELRKVMNAVIRRHGKPDLIRIELAREMRRNREQRERLAQRMEDNKERRDEAREALTGHPDGDVRQRQPSRADEDKYLLWKESGGLCPYSRQMINYHDLYSPKYQIEHIIPFSRCLDDSFANKTLCHHEWNKRKDDRTPYEAFHHTEHWEAILECVRRFRGPARAAKLRRFQLHGEALDEFLEDFRSGLLNDTRYASRAARKYLGHLYGKLQKVQVGRGDITANLRGAWGLNAVLNDGSADKKSRYDHRHHAIDAAVIALTSPAILKKAADAAERAWQHGHHKWWRELSLPDGFVDDVRKAVNTIVVSHRVNHKIRGGMHKDTIYSQHEYENRDGEKGVRIRKALQDLSEGDIEEIVDDAVRKAVRAKLKKPQSVKKLADDPPLLPNNHDAGRPIPIKRVRVWQKVGTRNIGSGSSIRRVKPGDNSHLEFLAIKDEHNKVIAWKVRLVSRLDAMVRLANHQPVVDRTTPPNEEFLFTLTSADTFEMDGPDGERELFVCRSISKEQESDSPNVEYVRVNEARKKDDIKRAKQWFKKAASRIREFHFRKKSVSPLGEVFPAND